MSFKDGTIDKRGNSYPWYCGGCEPRNDKHEPDCQYRDKPLKTEREHPDLNNSIRPSFCKACGCTYSNGCPEHSIAHRVSLVKR